MFHFWPAPTGMPQPSHTIEGPFPTLHFDRDEATSLVADAVQGVWEWLDNAFTLVLVVRLDTVEPNTNYAAISAGATDSTFIAFGVVDAEAGMFTSGNSARCGITVGAGSWHIYCFQSRTGLRGSASLSADSWVDGSAGNALHVAERLHSSSIVAGLEHHEGGRNGWQGDIAELLMFDGALSDGDRRRVEQYLSDKYEIELR